MNLRQIVEEVKNYIPNTGAIRGDIELPDSLYGASIIWKSSDPLVICDCKAGEKMPGIVNRGDVDIPVELTATVSLGGETEEVTIPVVVLARPKRITEDDYAGYLFGYFIGEETPDSEQIYFALSSKGLHFTDLNACKPVLKSSVGECGVRDPYIGRSREGDRYFLVATDLSIHHRGGWFQNEQGYYDASTTGSSDLVLWQSTDLVNWGEPTLIHAAPDHAGMAWAPEIIFYEKTAEYLIFFSSSIMDPVTKRKAKPNAIYYIATRDFVHFSSPKILIDNQTDGSPEGKKREIIDTTILKIGDWYYSASKDGDNAEENGGILILKSKNLLDPSAWIKVLDLDDLGLDLSQKRISVLDNSSLEGPELFRYNKRDWADPCVPEYGIMADQYMLGTGYLPLKTTDLEDRSNAKGSWSLLSDDEYSFDRLKKRHGTILPITQDELERIEKAFQK